MPSTARTRGRAPGYPWMLWLDGEAHIIERGRDFELEPKRMRKVLLAKGHERGRSMSVVVSGDRIAFESRENPHHRLRDLLRQTAIKNHVEEHARAWGLR